VRTLVAIGAALALALPAAARAGTFATRGGEAGILDVPTADLVGTGGGLFAGELRLDRVGGRPTSFGPLPLAVVMGVAPVLDVGFSMREWGRPGDPQPSPLLFGAATKLGLLDASGLRPALALAATVDRINWRPVSSLRLVASTPDVGRFRLAAFAGGEVEGRQVLEPAPTFGVGATVRVLASTDAIVEAVGGGRGTLLNGALRFGVGSRNALTLGVSALPGDGGARLSLGFSLHAPAPSRRRRLVVEEPAAPAVVPVAEEKPAGPRFTDERPRFRLKLQRVVPAPEAGRRHRHFARAEGAPGVHAPAEAAPGVEERDLQASELDLLASQLDARERRLRAAEASLLARHDGIAGERERLAARDAEAAQVVAGQDAREASLRAAGRPGEREAMLARSEEQARDAEGAHATAERRAAAELAQALARDRAAEARVREHDAAVARLAGALPRDGATGAGAARAQLLAARGAQLAALEERLTTARDLVTAAEAEVAARGARIAAFERRLVLRAERLAAVQRRQATRGALGPDPAVAAALPGSAELTPHVGAAEPVVLGAPTVARAVKVPEAERVVASAFVQLAPREGLRADDRQAVEAFAAAARAASEIVVWARTSPALAAQGARAADEIRSIVEAAGVEATRITTRESERDGATAVDVVVVAPHGAARAAGDPARLQDGAAGPRQVAAALDEARPDFERCLEAGRPLRTLQGQLRIAVDATGWVASVAGIEAGGARYAECLRDATPRWRMPASGSSYAIEVPITIPGATR
jgi:hypothetical protein